MKPRRLGGRLEVRKLVKAGIGCPASDPDPCTVPQVEKAAKASSRLAPFLQLELELSLLWMNRCRWARSAIIFRLDSGTRRWMQ